MLWCVVVLVPYEVNFGTEFYYVGEVVKPRLFA